MTKEFYLKDLGMGRKLSYAINASKYSIITILTGAAQSVAVDLMAITTHYYLKNYPRLLLCQTKWSNKKKTI
jgi:hypothetical protein